MAGLDQGEDFFSDDDFDTLPQNALDELEQNAILYTQHQTQATLIIGNPQSSDYGDGLGDDDLDDAVVIDEAQNLPEGLHPLQSRAEGPSTQREQFRQIHYARQNSVNSLPTRLPVQQLNSPGRQFSQYMPEQLADEGHSTTQSEETIKQAGTDITVETLQKQIQEVCLYYHVLLVLLRK
jgi:hypothetical protein